MLEHRSMGFLLLAFAVSLGALGVAAGSAFVRCGAESDCSYELALSIVAFAPAALIAGIVLLLMRARAELRWLQTGLLIVGVGVAIAPLAAFVLRDLRLVPAFGALVAALLFLLIWAEREAARRWEWVAAAEPEAAPEVVEEAAPTAEPAGAPIEAPPETAPPARPRIEGVASLLEEMTALNGEIVRLCEAAGGRGSR